MSIIDVWGGADYAPTAARLAPAAATIVDYLASRLPPGSRVLDVGAGHGHLTRLLADWETTAIEPVPAMADVGKRACPQARWITATGEATTVPDGSVDAVVSNSGAFLCNPETAATEWRRVLTPGGQIRSHAGYVLITARRA